MNITNETNNNIYCLDIAGYDVLDGQIKRGNKLAKCGRKHSLDTIGEKSVFARNMRNHHRNNSLDNGSLPNGNNTLCKDKAVQTFPQKKHSWGSKLWSSVKPKRHKNPSSQKDQVNST